MTFEMLGLPGSGKTTMLSKHPLFSNLTVRSFKDISSFLKIFYMLVGFLSLINKSAFVIILKLAFIQTCADSVLRLLVRLGCHRTSDAIYDEGILQAIWGVMRKASDRLTDKELSILLCSLVSNPEILNVCYVSVSKKELLARHAQRSKVGNHNSFIFSSECDFMLSRMQMARLLGAIRRSGIRISFFKGNKH